MSFGLIIVLGGCLSLCVCQLALEWIPGDRDECIRKRTVKLLLLLFVLRLSIFSLRFVHLTSTFVFVEVPLCQKISEFMLGISRTTSLE